MRMRGGSLLLAIAVAACSAQQRTPPTVDEAQAFLAEMTALARAGDFEGLCEVAGDGNCERKLDDAGRDRVPSEAPTVVGARLVPSSTSGDQTSLGGLVLVMCGVDGLGSPYESEMLVFRDPSMTLRAINPVYWHNITVASGGEPITSIPAKSC
jgi:hypothetical protein